MNLEERLKAYRDDDLKSLLKRKKLHLVLDLDHTLIHATNKTSLTLEDKQLITNPKITLHEFLRGTKLLKLRPGVDLFLKQVSTMFDLSVFTMGIENYGKIIVGRFLRDIDNGVRFREVYSREDCLVKDKKSLDLFMSHERVVVIVDDTEDVWMNSSHNEANLIKIAPYDFFSFCGVSNPRSKLEGETGHEESVMDEELARVLAVLRSVHEGFYGSGLDCVDRDVREVLKLVRECEEHKRDDGREEGEEIKKARNGKRSYEASVDEALDSGEPRKIYKACNVVDRACLAC